MLRSAVSFMAVAKLTAFITEPKLEENFYFWAVRFRRKLRQSDGIQYGATTRAGFWHLCYVLHRPS